MHALDLVDMGGTERGDTQRGTNWLRVEPHLMSANVSAVHLAPLSWPLLSGACARVSLPVGLPVCLHVVCLACLLVRSLDACHVLMKSVMSPFK